MASSRVYLFIAHGSREPAAQAGFESLLQSLRKPFEPHAVVGAYLTLNQPSIAEAVEACVKKGAVNFVIVPLFFFEGTHLKKDIPQILADLKLQHPLIDFHVMPAIASIEGFSDWVVASSSKSVNASKLK